MGRNLLDTPFTSREQAYGSAVAAGLWVLSVALLVILAAWSLDAPWSG
jgi:hypothetical protein